MPDTIVRINFETTTPLTSNDQDELMGLALSAGFPPDVNVAVQQPAPPVGNLGAIDPTIITLVCKVAGGAAAAAAITGLFSCLAEWIKARGQIVSVKVNDVTISAPATTTKADILELAERVAEVSRKSQTEAKNRGDSNHA